MNHDYMGNPGIDKCLDCGYPENMHGDNATCECCDKTGNLQIFGNGRKQMLLTRECMAREHAALMKEVDDYQTPEKQERRSEIWKAITNPYDRLIQQSHKIDEQLHLKGDVFMSKVIPINEIRIAIFNNPDIPADKKYFEYVSECKRRINHLQKVIFDLDEQKIEAYSEQKAWHISMNDYANKLRAEEREQLRISDITYDVKIPKVVTPRAIAVNKKAVGKKELRDAVNKLNIELGMTGDNGLSEITVSMMMVSKNWTLDQTINHVRRTIKEGRSESN